MQPHYHQPKRPCKFGMDCHKFKNGQCTFGHDMQQPYHGQTNQGGRGYMNPSQGGRGKFNPDNQNGSFNPPTKPPTTYKKPNNKPDPMQQYCRFYQQGQCKNEGKCQRIHGFTKSQNMVRSYFNREVVTDAATNLGKFTANGKNYLSFKNGIQLSFLEYDFQKRDVTLMDQCTMKDEKYHYIATKQKYVYFAYENSNGFVSIGFYDIFEKGFVFMENAHKKSVTDIVHQPINGIMHVLSASIDGTIKAWKLQNNQLEYNQLFTDTFKQLYDNGNPNIEIQFLDHRDIGGTKSLVAGTNDGRLLFWIGDQMNYQQAVFPQNYSKVLGVKFVRHQQAWVGIVLVWTSDMNKSALIGLDLGTFNPSLLMELTTEGSRMQLITEMETLGESMLLVSSLSGTVTIYNIPNFQEKVGFIMHHNPIANMISSSINLSTGINLDSLYIVERPGKKGNGSLAVYILK